MSLNRTLDRLFDVIRKEARRNPAFADQLDAVLRAHASRRDVDEEALEEAEAPEVQDRPTPPAAIRVELNPVALFLREGEDALRAELEEPAYERDVLLALVSEHNLDPGGEADALERADLAELIVARAKRRAERDRKLFDY